MITTFSFPTRIVYGPGCLRELPDRLQALNIQRPLVVTDPGMVFTPAFKQLEALAGGRWPVFAQVQPNPTLADVEACTQAYQQGDCDGVIALGGGSALDVGKVIRLRIKRPQLPLAEFDFQADWSGLAPFIAIPTTAGTGSEVGRSSVIIFGGRKQVIFHPSLLATVVFLDPELTLGLPARITAATGADALTHCIESFTSPVFHPLCDGIALEGIHLIACHLQRAVHTGSDVEARGGMQLAAMMGGIAFQKDLGATHSLAHPLSSVCGLHHGLANALCLPVVMEWNARRCPGIYRRVGQACGLGEVEDEEVIDFIRTLFADIGILPGLANHGVNESHLETLTNQAVADSCHLTNPVPVSREDLLALYRLAL